ncbi:DUF3099 domain-containing protein [Isoptericola sp. NPDC019693]|uniref:DUF3099 domain-containing protein n=1 Tax=Isoptericola sp. NPDC019693 TaxID=3364009 RepID=UPI0037879BB7
MSNARATPPGPRPSGGHRRGAGQAPEVPSITSAPEPLEEDQARRTRRYLVQMGIRIVCFIGAVLVDVLWIRLVLVAAAVVLPYSAVLFANAGRDRVSYDTSPMVDVAPAELAASAQEHPPSGPAAGSGPETFDGPHRVVEHRDDDPAPAAADETAGHAPHETPHASPDESPHETPHENPGGTR